MKEYLLEQLFEKPISGEWGNEVAEGKHGVKVIRTTNFTKSGLLDLTDVVTREINIEKYANKILQNGDIIIEKSGGSPQQPVGRTVLFGENADVYFCNNFTAILRPKNGFNPQYLVYLLRCLYKQKKVLKFQNKTTGIINLKLNDYLANTKVMVHKIENQTKIADVLDKAQELVDKRKEQIAACDELIKSLFYHMFGDPINSKKYKYEKMKNIVVKLTDGTHKSPPNINKGIPYITAKHLGSGRLNFYASPTYISVEEHEKIFSRCNPTYGDVLYIKDGATTGIAAINIYDFEFSMLSSLALIKTKKYMLNEIYLVNYLNNERVKSTILQDMAGGAIKRLTLNKINQIGIMLPHIDLQNDFAKKVEKIEQQKQLLTQSLTELENNFNSLMQRAFKGELF